MSVGLIDILQLIFTIKSLAFVGVCLFWFLSIL